MFRLQLNQTRSARSLFAASYKYARAASTSAVPDTSAKPKGMSPSTVAILKATAPAVKAHGTAITSTMYRTMFTEFPEIKNLFNMTHHRGGTLPDGSIDLDNPSFQARALANSVIAFAANADKLENLGEAVTRITHKHVSLNILPEHYPVVGTCLLRAIKTVLQDAATPEIMEAWEEGYWFLADLLIGVEADMCKQFESETGGWSGFRNLRIARKVKESDEITSFYLESADPSKPLMNFTPGQYLSLKFPALKDHDMVRNYSISCASGHDYYRISVKKEKAENAPPGLVSSHLHDNLDVGSEVLVGPPCGHFTLKETTKPLVFISGGVGVTPLLSMVESLVATGLKQPVVFVQYARNPSVVAFNKQLNTWANEHELLSTHAVMDSDEGAFNLAELEKWIPSKDCEYYFCGPSEFMTTVHSELSTKWEIPAEQCHFEYFGPTQDISSETAVTA